MEKSGTSDISPDQSEDIGTTESHDNATANPNPSGDICPPQEEIEEEPKSLQPCQLYDLETTAGRVEGEPSQCPESQITEAVEATTMDQDVIDAKDTSVKIPESDQETRPCSAMSNCHAGDEDEDFGAAQSSSASSVSSDEDYQVPYVSRLPPSRRSYSYGYPRRHPHPPFQNRRMDPNAGNEDGSDSDEEGGSSFEENLETLPDSSPQRQEWIRRKQQENIENKWLDKLMSMVGLENIKAQFLAIVDRVEVAKRIGKQDEVLRNERFDALFVGNSGTGKNTVARLYARFLASLNIVSSYRSVQTSGPRPYGAETFDRDRKTPRVLIITGKEMNNFVDQNPQAHYLPQKLIFDDYSDQELLHIWTRMIRKRSLTIEGGADGVYSRILIRRVARGRGARLFGNVHNLKSELSKILDRQARRLHLERTEQSRSQPAHTESEHPEAEPNLTPEVQNPTKDDKPSVAAEDLFLTVRDLLGPEPSEIRDNIGAWKELERMVGLDDIKEAIDTLYQLSCDNYQREIQGKKTIEISLNRVFLGPPGTGKSTVARLYGEILASLGLLSSGEIVVKDFADFHPNTLLDATRGKVLVIDNTHMLNDATTDHLIAGLPNTPGEDRCVILIGYPKLMKDMFEQPNPGFQSRFHMNAAFRFQDYNDSQLGQILDLMLSRDGLSATEEARRAAIKVLSLERDQPNFGNGRAVENLLNRAKAARHKRELTRTTENIVFTPLDFDPEYGKVSQASENCAELFKDFVGYKKIIKQFQEYQKVAAILQARGKDPRNHIPFTFVFKGPPGTGKTVTARKLGQIYYDMGLLSKPEVVECSVSDVVGEYVGQTEAKVARLFNRALGKVLFIDEAYRLAGSSEDTSRYTFGAEAIGELVDGITKTKYSRKLVIVLAGYNRDMDRLMGMNQGLRSRFPTEIVFPRMQPKACLRHLQWKLKEYQIQIVDDEGSNEKQKKILDLFAKLHAMGLMDNGRDVETLAESISRHVLIGMKPDCDDESPLTVSTDEIIQLLLGMN
ncbi:Stage V sporulation protein K [Drechslerella dactyloides]|uniref:Stage V sporulation protein K n=1 Tax=Drechslerella dactyloides TaxID=74499 RepID=A0AAD6IRV1_DREDA|nr:Stage V sporulation protein K [Drechslerella dactyloides]